jgi:hypothetical protein
MVTKHLVTIEFRYCDIPKGEYDTEHKSKTITLGVFDTFDEAANEGNKAMEAFEKHFKLNVNYNRKERFSKNGGCFGSAKDLITPLAYLQCPFEFYAKITPLKYYGVEETINEALEATKRFREYSKD